MTLKHTSAINMSKIKLKRGRSFSSLRDDLWNKPTPNCLLKKLRKSGPMSTRN